MLRCATSTRRPPLLCKHGRSRRSNGLHQPCQYFSSNNKQVSAKRLKWAGGAVLAAVFSGTMAARYMYSSIHHHNQNNNNHHSIDSSKAVVRIKHSPPGQRPIPQKAVASTLLRQVNADEFAAFLQSQRTLLHDTASRHETETSTLLHQELSNAMQDAHTTRVKQFADWYFAYATTYKLLGMAMSSAMKHAVSLGQQQQTLSERVSQDLQEYIGRKYQAIVLRPANTNPKIHRAFLNTLTAAHEKYVQDLQNLDEAVTHYVQEQAGEFVTQSPTASDVVITLDWATQLQKVQHVPVQYEKFPERSLFLVASGAAAGKVAGGVAMGTAVKAMAAKLAAPFATHAAASALGGKVAAGAVSGSALAGPVGGVVGAVAGAAVGVGVDMSVNAGISLLQRKTFEQDVHQSLDDTLLEWHERLVPELHQVQRVWYSHAESILGSSPSDDKK